MDIVKLFEEDVGARKRLAELLVGEPDIRLAIINAVLRDVATKSDVDRLRDATRQDIDRLRNEFRNEIERLREEFRNDIEKLRKEFREEIARLEKRIDGLEERVTRLEERVAGLDKRIDMVFKFMLMLNTPILVAVIGILLKMILTP